MTTSNTDPIRERAASIGERTESDLLSALDAVRERRGTVTVACRYRCATGTTFGGEWRGVPVEPLLDAAPADTTHLRAESADGYWAHVPVREALDAVVATERLDDSGEGLPRLVGPEFDSSRTVRDLATLVPVALPPGTDPETAATRDDGSAADAAERDGDEQTESGRNDA